MENEQNETEAENTDGQPGEQYKKTETVYATFNARMLAITLDVVLLYIVALPILNWLVGMFFDGMSVNASLVYTMKVMREVMSGLLSPQEAIALLGQVKVVEKWVLNNVLQVIVFGVYVILCWKYYAMTPGMWIMRLRLKDARDPSYTVSTVRLVWRYVGCIISGIPLMLGYVWTVFDKRNQAWHDKMADTIVIDTKRWERPVRIHTSGKET